MAQQEPITVGCQVELELVDRAGYKDHLQVVIVPDSSADYSQGFLSEDTPLAQAILGEHAGSVIPYLKDDILSIEILLVTKATLQPAPDAAEKRKNQMIKTMLEVENTNAMVFASSFSGKWGDYDPDSLPNVNNSGEATQDSDQKKPK
ncbi:MAG: hypothetical protein C3F13_11895 [Anaerolineales bacterium]|nr:MAG: hypothetical protein C3F13_11895 [Anaerolineales bacterium]